MNMGCIKCGEGGKVSVDIDEGETLRCSECDEEYTADDVREHITAWRRVLAWMDMHPSKVEEPAVA